MLNDQYWYNVISENVVLIKIAVYSKIVPLFNFDTFKKLFVPEQLSKAHGIFIKRSHLNYNFGFLLNAINFSCN